MLFCPLHFDSPNWDLNHWSSRAKSVVFSRDLKGLLSVNSICLVRLRFFSCIVSGCNGLGKQALHEANILAIDRR